MTKTRIEPIEDSVDNGSDIELLPNIAKEPASIIDMTQIDETSEPPKKRRKYSKYSYDDQKYQENTKSEIDYKSLFEAEKQKNKELQKQIKSKNKSKSKKRKKSNRHKQTQKLSKTVSSNTKSKERQSQDKQNEINYKELYEKERDKNYVFEFTIWSLHDFATKLPSANVTIIEWEKGKRFDNFTQRTKEIHHYREIIQSASKYQNAIKNGRFIIENNPIIDDCVYTKKDHDEIQRYFEMNMEGEMDPFIYIKPNNPHKLKRLHTILGIRRVENCVLPQLNGESETFAKRKIDRGVILGQYCGHEMLKEEYFKIYNGTREEAEHYRYLHGTELKLTKINKTIDLFIDPFDKFYRDKRNCQHRKSPLIFINDARFNIKDKELQKSDKQRINCEYVEIMVNGFVAILVRTTKRIKKDETLWISYGPQYDLVMNVQETSDDQKHKMKSGANNIMIPAMPYLCEKDYYRLV